MVFQPNPGDVLTSPNRSIRFEASHENRSMKAVQTWGDGKALLQRPVTSGWIALDSSKHPCSDRIVLRLNNAIIPLKLPEDMTDGRIDTESLNGGNVIIQLNGKPWVGLIKNRNGSLPLEATQWVCTDVPQTIPQTIRSFSIIGSNIVDAKGIIGASQLRELRFFHCPKLSDIDSIVELAHLELLRLHQCSHLKSFRLTEALEKLSVLNIEWCERLNHVPDFSFFPALKALAMHWCAKVDRLTGLETSQTIESIDLRACNALRTIPIGSENQQLTTLTVAWFKQSTTLPHLPNLKALKQINLFANAELTKVPDLSGLNDLTHVNLSGCTKLESFEANAKLPSLTDLKLSGCSQLEWLNIANLPNLKDLHLGRCSNLVRIDGLKEAVNLENLHISGSSQLNHLNGIDNLKALKSLYLGDCGQIKTLELAHVHTQMTELHIYGCGSLKSIVGQLLHLKRLQVGGCRALSKLPDFGPDLEYLNLSWLEQLDLPDFTQLTKLKSIKLSGRANLKTIGQLDKLRALEKLELSRCQALKNVEGIESLVNLRSLDLRGCVSLKRINGLSGLINLETLLLGGCHALLEIDDALFLDQLTHLDLGHCRNLTHIPDLSALKRLQILDLSHRIAPVNLKPISHLKRLQELNLDESEQVTHLDSLAEIASLRDLVWVDHGKSQSILAATALKRQDLGEIAKRLSDWLQAFTHTQNGDDFAKRISGCLSIAQELSWAESKWREFVTLCKGRNNNGMKALDPETWKSIFTDAKAAGVLGPILHLVFRTLHPRIEGDNILKPALEMTKDLNESDRHRIGVQLSHIQTNLSPSLKRRFQKNLILAFANLKKTDAIKSILAEQQSHPQAELRRAKLVEELKLWGEKTNENAWIDALFT